MNHSRGILLAGGSGTRLYPLTKAITKHLLPIFDKPMIYYSLSALMLAQIQEILIISTSRDLPLLRLLLGTGSQWGMSFDYAIQDRPNGIAEAITIGSDFIEDRPLALMLGDNFFHGPGLGPIIQDELSKKTDDASIFAYPVRDPAQFGVVTLDSAGNPISLVEKPESPTSKFAVPGLYLYGKGVSSLVQEVRPSTRGELEITDLNRLYLGREKLAARVLGRGFAWLDMGTISSLRHASEFVAALQERTGYMVGSPEEIAWRNGWISSPSSFVQKERIRSPYVDYLSELSQN